MNLVKSQKYFLQFWFEVIFIYFLQPKQLWVLLEGRDEVIISDGGREWFKIGLLPLPNFSSDIIEIESFKIVQQTTNQAKNNLIKIL